MGANSLSQAKASLGRLADRALKTGKPVIIARRGWFVPLAPWQPIEPFAFSVEGALPVMLRERELEKLAGPDLRPDEA